ncbi:hypothetical protein K435DRAFT_875489 [Dendrothele bispora CBS 962.96]|uniref:NAD(P)-binding protein n=1 Tax=Dendrothele bispora (strain CBS 962.96) TaxID=1314807 RepID=A0A4S8KUF3_DENBC|nr:hypothetical protein K435DRAFT_875489 [Dendrothele bispora CBS 962.96]
MTDFTQHVPVYVLENDIDHCIREGHFEFIALHGLSVDFTTIHPSDIQQALEVLRTGFARAIFISRPLVGSLHMDHIVYDATALATKSFNMIKSNNGVLHGINTDFLGIHSAVMSAVPDPKYREVLVLGTGPMVKAAVYVLAKYFCCRKFYLKGLASSDTVREMILDLDANSHITPFSSDANPSRWTISCIVTDTDLTTDCRAIITKILHLQSSHKYSDHRGIFLDLGLRSGVEDSWSSLADDCSGWVFINPPMLQWASVPATWEQIGIDNMSAFICSSAENGPWFIDRTVTGI